MYCVLLANMYEDRHYHDYYCASNRESTSISFILLCSALKTENRHPHLRYCIAFVAYSRHAGVYQVYFVHNMCTTQLYICFVSLMVSKLKVTTFVTISAACVFKKQNNQIRRIKLIMVSMRKGARVRLGCGCECESFKSPIHTTHTPFR